MSAAVTLAQLAQVSSPILAAIDPIRRSTAGIGDELVRKNQLSALDMLQAAVTRWADGFAREVVAGKRTLERWRDYGSDLALQLERHARDVGDFSVQWSRLANNVGNVAQAVLDARDKVFAKVAKLEADLKSLGTKRKSMEERRKLLANQEIAAESRELLFGPTADNALRDYERFRVLVAGLTSIVKLVKGGKASLQADGKGDVKAVPTTQLGAVTLGATALAAGAVTGAVLVTIALAASIATSLFAFFRHLDERLAVDLKQAELKLISEGKGAEVVALKKAQAETEKSESGSGFGEQIATGAKALGGLAAFGLAIYAGKKIVDSRARGSR